MGDDQASLNAAEAARFLERDFNQCFAQMRHYDNQLWQICKFAFTGYTATIGTAVALYQLSLDEKLDLVPAALSILVVAVVLGVFLLALTVRNRVYYVVVTRYINEHRRHFLAEKPLGFQNETSMYTNPSQPPYFNWRSSQAWFLYMIVFLNSVLVAFLAFLFCGLIGVSPCCWVVAAFAVAALLQLVISITYLLSREKKGASLAVFGRE